MKKWFTEESYTTEAEKQALQQKYKDKDIIWNYVKLEIAITDYCNLACPNCSQAVPLIKNKQTMSLSHIKNIAKLTDGHFDIIKISGGEPTMHPQFREITESLHSMFPKAKGFEMATNGFKLLEYKDIIHNFDWICLSNYPGLNDKEYNEILKQNFPNVYPEEKIIERDLVDIKILPNIDKQNIFEHCSLKYIYKVTQDRLYPCCMLFAVSVMRTLDRTKVSTKLDEEWKINLFNLDKQTIEQYCRLCPYNINTSSYPVMITELDQGKVREIYPFHKGDIAKANYGIKQKET